MFCGQTTYIFTFLTFMFSYFIWTTVCNQNHYSRSYLCIIGRWKHFTQWECWNVFTDFGSYTFV